MAKKKQKADDQGQATPPNNGRAQGGGESVSGYFRKIFAENPKLLDSKSNAELLDRWLADNPGETEVPARIRNNLANLKSVLRKKGRKKAGRKKAAEQPQMTNAAAITAAPKRTGSQRLEALEEQIDDCLSVAKGLDRDGLDEVIRLLRRARNTVVWKMGQ